MKLILPLFFSCAIGASCVAALPDLSTITTPGDLEAIVSAAPDAATKGVLKDNAAAILAAALRYPHVAAVLRTVEGAKGKVEKVNTTPAALKAAAGGEVNIFDNLKLVDTAVPNAGPHDVRTADPYDAAFFAHLGHLDALESLNIIATKANDEWIAPIGQLSALKALRFTNNGKLTDAGLEKLAGLQNLEAFSFVGTQMLGHAFAKMEGWTHVTRCSFRGSSIDDEGIRAICEHLPNLENLSLAHAKFTDAGAVCLSKLTKLKGLELGLHNATPACLQNLKGLPLEYLQLGEGLDAPAAIAALKQLPTLRRVTLTQCDKLDDAGLALVASLTQLTQLELGTPLLPDERLPQLAAFSFLKELKLIRRPQPYPEETQAKIKALLPKVDVKFQ